MMEYNNMADATDEFQLENMCESLDALSGEEEEVPEVHSKDLMEEDMIGEYNDNINVEEGSNPQKASIDAKSGSLFGMQDDFKTENKVLQKLMRAPRYFDPPECFLPEYDNWDQNKHECERHKVNKKRTTCYICGDTGHDGKRCKKVNACVICSKKGHLVTDCPEKDLDVDCASQLCLKCGNTGHDTLACTNDYDSEDLKDIQCYICQEFGHLCCVDSKTEEGREASCYRCGESGHLGSECIKENAVANDPQSVPATSSKSTMQNHAPAVSKSAKKKARKARKMARNQPVLANGASQGQPNGPTRGWRPPMVGPYYGRPGSNVWLSPAARNNPNHPPPARESPSHQIPQHTFSLITRPPHLIWNGANQSPQQPPLTHQTGYRPRAKTQMYQNSFTHPSQLTPHVSYNSQPPPPPIGHQYAGLLPQIAQTGHQTGILLPHQIFGNQTETSTSSPSVSVMNQMSQNSLTRPSQLVPHVIYNNQPTTPPIGHQNADLLPQRAQIGHQPGILLPHQIFGNQTENSTSSPSVTVMNPSSASS